MDILNKYQHTIRLMFPNVGGVMPYVPWVMETGIAIARDVLLVTCQVRGIMVFFMLA